MSRIVVIDDEPVLRFTFSQILESEGHEVWDAENGRAGIELCRRTRPDLVITDVTMPEQGGEETLQALRDEFPGLPVIVMSGGETLWESGPGNRRDEVCFVMKPLESVELLGLVHRMLSR